MKPESVLRLPLPVHPFADGPRQVAIIAMCNAYPLALKLAEAAKAMRAEGIIGSASKVAVSVADCDALSRALAAFLAHRTPAQDGEKGGEQ